MNALFSPRPSFQQIEAHIEMARRERAKVLGNLIALGFECTRKNLLRWAARPRRAAVARGSAGTATMLCLALGSFAFLGIGRAADRLKDTDRQLCAAFDLRVVSQIEKLGEASAVSPELLLHAHYGLMSARRACAEGRLAQALAAYEAIRLERLE